MKGDPTPEELGALVAVVACLRRSRRAGRASYAGLERARAGCSAESCATGPGAWRGSGLPQA